MEKVRSIIKFILTNFGPILVFYAANHFCGIRIAVVASTAWTIGEVVFQRIKGKSTSTLFKFSAAITIVFGILDMYLQRSLFFRYEAAATNVLIGFYFGSTLFSEKSLIQEFAEAQGRIKSEITADTVYFFKFITAVWTIYMFAKAGFYAWIAYYYSLEEGLAIRGTIGNATFYGLLFISIVGAKRIKQGLAALKLLPSTRDASTAS